MTRPNGALLGEFSCCCLARSSSSAGARNLMFTVSLAADPERTVELFGKEVLPVLDRD